MDYLIKNNYIRYKTRISILEIDNRKNIDVK